MIRYMYFVTWERPSQFHPRLSYALTTNKKQLAYWQKDAKRQGKELTSYRHPLVSFNEGFRYTYGWDLPTLIVQSERII